MFKFLIQKKLKINYVIIIYENLKIRIKLSLSTVKNRIELMEEYTLRGRHV